MGNVPPAAAAMHHAKSNGLMNGTTESGSKIAALDSLMARNNARLDTASRNVLLHIADNFIDQTIITACKLAHHRKSKTLVTKGIQLTYLLMV